VRDWGDSRFFVGHIHIGYKSSLPDWAVVQGFEALGYIPSILEKGYDYQPSRRRFYGVPGLYRTKPYGIEYRVPSNIWVQVPDCVEDATSVVTDIINKPKKFEEIWSKIDFAMVQDIIRTEMDCRGGNVTLEILRELRAELKAAPNE